MDFYFTNDINSSEQFFARREEKEEVVETSCEMSRHNSNWLFVSGTDSFVAFVSTIVFLRKFPFCRGNERKERLEKMTNLRADIQSDYVSFYFSAFLMFRRETFSLCVITEIIALLIFIDGTAGICAKANDAAAAAKQVNFIIAFALGRRHLLSLHWRLHHFEFSSNRTLLRFDSCRMGESKEKCSTRNEKLYFVSENYRFRLLQLVVWIIWVCA